MIIMWLGAWLYNFLGGTHDSWWAFPFIMTFALLAIAEVFVYVVVCIELEMRSRNKSH